MINVLVEVEENFVVLVEEKIYELAPNNWVVNCNLITGKYSLEGFFEDVDSAENSYVELINNSDIILQHNPVYKTIKDIEWKNSYKKHFRAWKFKCFHWVPIWKKDSYLIPDNDNKLYLDPSMAFGTGNHETTKLCLESIVSISETLPLDQKKSFLDVGCGSGILALTASKLGFTTISAIDNDADAIKVSIENSDLNGVKNVIFDRKSIEKFIPTTKYDVVVANIQSDILICYSSELVKLLNKKSYLILSGILKTENNAIDKHFKSLFSEKQNVSYQSRNLNDWNLTIIKLDEY